MVRASPGEEKALLSGVASPGVSANLGGAHGSGRGSSPPGRRYLVNAVVLSLGFFGMFIAYSATQNLESSLNADVGYWSVATIYFTITVLTLIAPPAVAWAGPRISMVFGGVCFVVFMAANLHPIWATMIPASFLLGAGASALWTAQGVYLTACARLYAAETGKEPSETMGMFTGIFFGFFQLNQMTGNLAAAGLLERKGSTTLLFIVFVALAGVSVLTFMFLRKIAPEDLRAKCGPSDSDDSGAAASSSSSPRQPGSTVSILDVARLHRDRRLLLLVPVVVYNGLSVAFAGGDFTKDAVRASLADPGDTSKTAGAHWIGYVMAANSAVNVLGSVGLGRLSDAVGRAPVMFVGLVAHVAFAVMCLSVDFNDGHKYYALLFGAAGLFGLGDAVLNTQINSILGVLFPERPEAAFSSFKMWQSAATAAAFFYGPKVNFDHKLYILLSFMGLAALSFMGLERERRIRLAPRVYGLP
jgi:MFS family permease